MKCDCLPLLWKTFQKQSEGIVCGSVSGRVSHRSSRNTATWTCKSILDFWPVTLKPFLQESLLLWVALLLSRAHVDTASSFPVLGSSFLCSGLGTASC